MLEEKNDNLQQIAEGNEQEIKKEVDAIESINESNAEQSEEISLGEDASVESLNLESLSMDELVETLKKLMQNHKPILIKDEAEEIRKNFYDKYNDWVESKKELFFHENPDAEEQDFQSDYPIKHSFEEVYNNYKSARQNQYKSIEKQLKDNLKSREEIIEELKALIDNTSNYNAALKDIQDIRERWKNAGAIPRDKYNIVWNDFHFHMERFYDQLHLDREARDLDFKHNLEQKQKLIEQAENLLNETNIPQAFRELQLLHRIWKEETGPVDREIREEIWQKFSDITKQLHDKKDAYYEQYREREKENLTQKLNIIDEIERLDYSQNKLHSHWQKSIKAINTLREKFFGIGRVPQENNQEVWDKFKSVTRNFNKQKNEFYKNIKKEQHENLFKKRALIDKARELKDSDDFERVTPMMIQIQEDWKKIGHVPRKNSDEIWKEFKETCNAYFDRYHSIKNKAMGEEMDNFNKKKDYLEELKSFEMTGDHNADLDAIKQHIAHWKSLGKVPHTRRHIEGKFNRMLDTFFDKLSMGKKEGELVKFTNRVANMMEEKDQRRIQKEFTFLQRKVDEVQSDIMQLENNMMFISGADKNNPLMKEINKNIERHKEELKLWKEKLEYLKNANNESE
ncbi:DUF349 domain-containing protein [Avrilella dinanensis]|uniref:Chromosome segregation protein n=1 Tax=Avrilella dinanensis TaxID=2008672 RepID=A0A2M9R4Z1_9FLAO|nr:DUF349 domain-containing protein [Avrilella dinanensis]PJR03934.1 chromosome segregation protein [Avrilella dinanensis]